MRNQINIVLQGYAMDPIGQLILQARLRQKTFSVAHLEAIVQADLRRELERQNETRVVLVHSVDPTIAGGFPIAELNWCVESVHGICLAAQKERKEIHGGKFQAKTSNFRHLLTPKEARCLDSISQVAYFHLCEHHPECLIGCNATSWSYSALPGQRTRRGTVTR